MTLPALLPRLLAALLAVALGAGAARAETVVMRNGDVLEASEVRLAPKGNGIVVTIKVEGGTASYTFAFARVDPASLLALLDARTPADDAAGQARLARIALEVGRRDEAALRIARAVALDLAFAPERDEIFTRIQELEVLDAVQSVERRLRAGDPKGALVLAETLLDGGLGVGATDEHVLRVNALAELARRILQAKASPTPAPAPPAPPGSPVPAPPGPLDEAAALEERALAARDAAADPAIPMADAIRHLEVAAKALLDARRLLAKILPPPTEEVAARKAAARDLLVATWLDLADLLRQAGDFGAALDRVRAALILDPGDERAWEIRRWIEEDLRLVPPLDTYFTPLAPAYPYALGGPWPSAVGYGRVYRTHSGGSVRHYPGTRR
jgi:hypothetical protein